MSSLYKKIQKKIEKRLKRENQELFFLRQKNTNNFLHCLGTNLETDELVYELLGGHIPAALWKKEAALLLLEEMGIVDFELVPMQDKSLKRTSSEEVGYIRIRGTEQYAQFAGKDIKGEHIYKFKDGFADARIFNIDHAKQQLEKVDVKSNLEFVTVEKVIKDSEQKVSNN